ncbi:hypothetical protein ACQPYK_18660 [Streptosporangium sp. CA-135522]|uniref:hypothetical protein n=1 Tax=Streptosporangium sp. CA-135522 TaxID=3240072 RepID=UPI003D913776
MVTWVVIPLRALSDRTPRGADLRLEAEPDAAAQEGNVAVRADGADPVSAG